MHKCESWLQKLYRSALRRAPVEGQPGPPARPVDLTIQLSEIASPGISELRSLPDWHTIVRPGCPVTLSWDGGPKRGTITVQGTVRLTFEEAVWIWLDEHSPKGIVQPSRRRCTCTSHLKMRCG